MNRAVFLDRDNTIIHAEDDIAHPDQVRLLKGAASAIASLRGLGYRIVVVSNQTGVAKGNLTEADVDAVNRRVAELIQYNSGATIDRFYYCPYHPRAEVEQYRAEHPWRKPAPGMLEKAAEDLAIDLEASWMIGDHRRDIAAGRAAGTRTVLLQPFAPETGYSLESAVHEDGDDLETPHFVARSLVEAVRLIAQRPPAERLEPPREPVADENEAHEEGQAAAQATDETQPNEASASSPAVAARPDAPETAQGDPAPDQPHPDDEAELADAASPAPRQNRPTSPETTSQPGADESTTARNAGSAADNEAADDHGTAAPDAAAPAESADAAPPPTPRPAPVEAAAMHAPDPNHSSGIPSPPHEELLAGSRPPHLQHPDAHTATARSPRPNRERTSAEPQPPAATDPALLEVLRSIQRDLKTRRADYGDFSYAKMTASLCQMLAIGCVLFGLLNLAEVDTFAKWMLGATFSQLLVITLLIVHGQR